MKKTLSLAVLVVLLSAFAQPVKHYVVTLVVEKTVYAPCPQTGKKDGFGRVIPNSCTRVHFCKQYDTLRFDFQDSIQGRAFYLEAFNQIGISPSDSTAGIISYVGFKTQKDTL
jgi:hypothetical protein